MRTEYTGRRPGQAAGFSLVELIVVIGVIAILAMIAVPNFTVMMHRQKTRGQAMDAMTVMRKARLDAATISKPVRVVVDCERGPCVMRSQIALYDQGEVSGWADIPGARSVFDEQVRAVRATPVGAAPDGGTVEGDLAWVIFTPGGKALSNPRPFGLYFSHSALSSGWRVSVNNNSGRAALNGHTQ